MSPVLFRAKPSSQKQNCSCLNYERQGLCIVSVEHAYVDITKGCLNERLEEIKRTGNELAEQSEQRAIEIESGGEVQRIEEIQKESGEWDAN